MYADIPSLQLRDYIIFLCANDSESVLTLLRRMIWIFMGFDAHQYLQCLLLNELHLQYLIATGNPSYIQFINHPRSHNEERGEMSLSLMSLSVLGDTDKCTVQKLDTHYSIMNFCRSLIKDYSRDTHIPLEDSHPLTTTKSTAEINRIEETMLRILEQMEAGTWTSFPSLPAKEPYFPSTPRTGGSRFRLLPRFPSRIASRELDKFDDLLGAGNFTTVHEATAAAGPSRRAPTEAELQALGGSTGPRVPPQ